MNKEENTLGRREVRTKAQGRPSLGCSRNPKNISVVGTYHATPHIHYIVHDNSLVDGS